MSDGLFISNVGSFAISSMSVGDTIGSASMTAGGGFINYNTSLVVSSVVSANQVVVESIDLSTGLSLGSFTLNNTTPGISIYEVVPPDNNTTTNGNSQTVTFSNIFQNPSQGPVLFTSTINSELGDTDVQTFTETLTCLCPTNTWFFMDVIVLTILNVNYSFKQRVILSVLLEHILHKL